MRAIKFVKIDLLKLKKLSWLLLFPALSFLILVRDPSSMKSLFVFFYCIMGGIIAASAPLSEQRQKENGFLKMLPAKNSDSMRGHFLYSLLAVLLFGILGAAAVLGGQLFTRTLAFGQFSVYPLVLGIGLLVAALENFLLCAFHFDNLQAQSLLRTVPAFIFFFGGQILLSELPGLVGVFTAWLTPMRSLLLFLMCLVIFWCIAEASTFFFSSRDEV